MVDCWSLKKPFQLPAGAAHALCSWSSIPTHDWRSFPQLAAGPVARPETHRVMPAMPAKPPASPFRSCVHAKPPLLAQTCRRGRAATRLAHGRQGWRTGCHHYTSSAAAASSSGSAPASGTSSSSRSSEGDKSSRRREWRGATAPLNTSRGSSPKISTAA
jgi:hypothetical protein